MADPKELKAFEVRVAGLLDFDSRDDAKRHKFQVGDKWEAPRGVREIVNEQGGKFLVQAVGYGGAEILSPDDLAFDVWRDMSNTKSQAEAKAKAEGEARQEEDRLSLLGYEDTLTKMQAGKARKSLQKAITYNRDRYFKSIKEFVIWLIKERRAKPVTEGREKVFKMSGGSFIVAPSVHAWGFGKYLYDNKGILR